MQARLRDNAPLLVSLALILLFTLNGVRTANVKQWVNIVQSGLYLASIFFLVASGFSLIFGLMDVLNFAHGTIFMFGAYTGYSMFANPRLFTNTVPLFCALFAGVLLARALVPDWQKRIRSQWLSYTAVAIIGLIAAGVTVYAVRGFPLDKLVKFSVVATGGAVPTEEAQEAISAMLRRMGLLLAAGMLFGALLPAPDDEERADTRTLLGAGIAVLVVGGIILFARNGVESFFLNTNVDLRFFIALVVGTATGALLGALMEWGLIRPLYARPIYQILLTLGLVFVGAEIVKLVWRPAAYPPMDRPSLFAEACTSDSVTLWLSEHCSAVRVLGRNVPTYRVFVMFVALMTLIGVSLLLTRTRLGMIIRAGVQDADMVQALGINVRRIFTLVFALGSALAALGGVVLAPVEGLNPDMGFEFLIAAVIAVVIGGLGSFPGAAIGALLVGVGRAVFDFWGTSGYPLLAGAELQFSPTVAEASTVIIMAIVLLIRPSGILGKKQ